MGEETELNFCYLGVILDLLFYIYMVLSKFTRRLACFAHLRLSN